MFVCAPMQTVRERYRYTLFHFSPPQMTICITCMAMLLFRRQQDTHFGNDALHQGMF